MKRRFRKVIPCLVLLLCIRSVSVLAISQLSVNYHFFSKKTAIRIENYTMKNGTYVPWKDAERTVLPGEYISQIPVIYNEGMDCYVRAQVTITSAKEPSIPVTQENIAGMDEKWILIGDYFYYKDVLLEEKDVAIFEGIYIPVEWDPSVDSGNQWEIQVKVDAIQAKYVVPDFQSEDPWREQKETFEILDAKEDEALEDEEMKGEFIFTIQSEVTAFQIGIEETFQNMGGFVPGDVKEQEIKVCNLDGKERILYMKAEVPREEMLLKEMEITVVWKCERLEMILYQGVVSKMCGTLERISLVVPGNADGILHVCFSIPKEVENDYAALEGSFGLVFSDEMIPVGLGNEQDHFMSWQEDKEILEDVKRPENFGKEQESEDMDKSADGDSALRDSSLVQTGDDSRIWNGIVGLSIAVCLFFLYLWKGKRGSHGL